jgi:hypothetical protein
MKSDGIFWIKTRIGALLFIIDRAMAQVVSC